MQLYETIFFSEKNLTGNYTMLQSRHAN